ncbi:GCR1-dependent translation factor 1 [Batrachochytrium dendrobatidis]
MEATGTHLFSRTTQGFGNLTGWTGDDVSGSPKDGQGKDKLQGLVMSFLVILVSEIGDKTFLIAAVLAMRNPRLLIFSAAMSALFLMTVISALLGQILPSLLSKQYTQILAAILFIIFGFRLLHEGYYMSGNEVTEELEEVTQELTGSTHKEKQEDLEAGSESFATETGSESIPMVTTTTQSDESDKAVKQLNHPLGVLWHGVTRVTRSWASVLFSPIWIQAFALTFVAEWGDRSQLATVALAGAEDFWWVTIGGLLGHAICSCVAVIGGRMVTHECTD